MQSTRCYCRCCCRKREHRARNYVSLRVWRSLSACWVSPAIHARGSASEKKAPAGLAFSASRFARRTKWRFMAPRRNSVHRSYRPPVTRSNRTPRSIDHLRRLSLYLQRSGELDRTVFKMGKTLVQLQQIFLPCYNDRTRLELEWKKIGTGK